MKVRFFAKASQKAMSAALWEMARGERKDKQAIPAEIPMAILCILVVVVLVLAGVTSHSSCNLPLDTCTCNNR